VDKADGTPLLNIQFSPATAIATAADQLTYDLAAKAYTGKPQGVSVTPKAGVGKVTAVYYNGSQAVPTNAGTYAVTVDVALGARYLAASGLPLGSFTINKANLSTATATIADTPWTGSQIKPALKAFTLSGRSFPISSNASVAYGANKNIGKGTITLTGKGNFTGTKTITFNIVPKANKVSKITAGKKQMKVTWSKVSSAQKITKYQVRYRVKGTTAWKTKTYAASKASAAIKSLKKGKAYQVQVRSYKTVSKVNFYSAWSPVKTGKKIK